VGVRVGGHDAGSTIATTHCLLRLRLHPGCLSHILSVDYRLFPTLGLAVAMRIVG